MASAFLSLTRLFESFLAFLAPQPAPIPCAVQRAPREAAVRHAAKPLRVVRVLEPSAPRSTAGRMVISGRLADVCAELERLAALEARGC